MSFHGSYAPADVTFLLKPIDMPPTPVAEREALIQSGERHYSELLAPESVPSATYLEFYRAALARNGPRLGREIAQLALNLARRGWDEVVLVSLARAGTPIGVLLRRALVALGQPAAHYSVSIIRGRGIDERALNWIAERHDPSHLVFVDGWTGKGAIANQLTEALANYPGPAPRAELVTVADLAGVAGLAATQDDYVIPSSILNAVVSGLVSRTVLNADYIGPGDFHGCVHYTQWSEADQSRAFVDEVMTHTRTALSEPNLQPASTSVPLRAERQRVVGEFMREIMARYGVTNRNRVKPGAGEATRAVLRRMPSRLLIRDAHDVETAHLAWLAAEKGVTVEVVADMPYRAVTLIQRLGQ